MTCECVARTLEQCKRFAQQRGLKLPSELVVMTDNTVRENKCTTFMLYLASLQARGMFSSVSFVQHIKGHTHNILDQLFGVISRSFQFCDHLPDIYSVAKEVEKNSEKGQPQGLLLRCRDLCLCTGVMQTLGQLHGGAGNLHYRRP